MAWLVAVDALAFAPVADVAAAAAPRLQDLLHLLLQVLLLTASSSTSSSSQACKPFDCLALRWLLLLSHATLCRIAAVLHVVADVAV